jgi:signal transduction histidine kinase/CHASE3 domain sensor protein
MGEANRSTLMRRGLAIVGPPCLVALVGATTLWSLRRGVDRDRLVTHSRLVESRVRSTLLAVTQGETGQRGYLLTGQDGYLVPYIGTHIETDRNLSVLDTLVQDNPEQVARAQLLQRAAEAKFAELDSTVRLRQGGHTSAALALVGADRGKALMDTVRLAADAMIDAERALLARRSVAAARQDATTQAIVLIGTALAVLLGLRINVMLTLAADAEAAARRAAEEQHALVQDQAVELEIQNQQLHDQAMELEFQNRQLHDQAIELESQADELHAQAAELEAANEDLGLTAQELSERNTRLTEAERRVSVLLESITDGFVALDHAWRFTFINARAEQMLGRTKDVLIGRTIWDEFGAVAGGRDDTPFHRAMREREPVAFEVFFAPVDSWFDIHAYPSADGLSVFFQNVSERHQADAERARLLAELADERGRLLTVLDQSPLAVAITEAPSGRVVIMNRQIAELFGARRLSDSIASYSDDFAGYHLDGRRYGAEEWPMARAVARGEVVTDEVIEIERPDGHRATISVTAAPVRDTKGSIVAGVTFFTDISASRAIAAEREAARREAEDARAAAEAANKAKSEFLTTMSHELRTPLNAISGYTELLESGIRGPVSESQLEDLRRIRRAGQHLLGLINDVLNYAKLEAAQVKFHVTAVSADEILREASAMIEPQARAKGVAFSRMSGNSGARVLGDREKVLQIVLNLLSNGVKFTRAGGEVRLIAATTASTVEIVVQDTGRGIPADQLGQVFEPFVQVGRRLSGPDEGAGLGLAISRELARGMGGELTARSVEGEGSTFTLSLPLHQANNGALPPMRTSDTTAAS